MGSCHCIGPGSENNTANFDPAIGVTERIRKHQEESRTASTAQNVSESPERLPQFTLPLSPDSVSFPDFDKLTADQRAETAKVTGEDSPIISEEPRTEETGSHLSCKSFILERLTPTSRAVYLSLSPFFYVTQASTFVLTALSSGALYFGETDPAQLPQGFGLRIDPDCTLLEGMWQHGALHGRGLQLHPNGDFYEGDFAKGEVQGWGKFVKKGGSRYEGQWSESRQNGEGVETWADGSVFTGTFRDGKKQGKGHFRWANGATYEGEFVDNQLQGVGRYVWSDGRVYEGTWLRNKMSGRGRFVWPDGKTYEGEYLADKRHGKGTFQWPNGRTYTGGWMHNKMHGYGAIEDHEGTVLSGEWSNGGFISASQ